MSAADELETVGSEPTWFAIWHGYEFLKTLRDLAVNRPEFDAYVTGFYREAPTSPWHRRACGSAASRVERSEGCCCWSSIGSTADLPRRIRGGGSACPSRVLLREHAGEERQQGRLETLAGVVGVTTGELVERMPDTGAFQLTGEAGVPRRTLAISSLRPNSRAWCTGGGTGARPV